MKEISTQTQAVILKWTLVFCFALGIFLIPFCQWYMKVYFMDYFGEDEIEFALANMEIYIFGISLLFDVFQLINICSLIVKGEIFSRKTASYIKYIAVMCFVDIIAFALKSAVRITLPSVLLMISFAVLGMFASVFSRLFKKAAEIKEENDLTI